MPIDLYMMFPIQSRQTSVGLNFQPGGRANSILSGKHWTAERVANTFAPHKETKDTVTEWLVDSGIDGSRLSFSTGSFIPSEHELS